MCYELVAQRKTDRWRERERVRERRGRRLWMLDGSVADSNDNSVSEFVADIPLAL